MGATPYDIVNHKAGDTETIVYPVKKSDGTKADLTGATAKWGIFAWPMQAGATPILEKLSPVGITFNVADGTASVAIAKGETGSLSSRYIHELEITLQSGESKTFQGNLVVGRTGYRT